MNNLKIYRASAGSGKTYQLSKEYIQLLFENHQAYRNTLAVTFTNKATEEMKGRILEELFVLAQGEKSPYKEELMEKFHLNEQQIQVSAKEILKGILHDYSRFTITTIDRFFQQIIRAMVRELGLYGNYQIELERKLVLQEAMSCMMEELDKPNSDQLREWLIRFSENKVEGQQSWVLNKDILSLGEEIFGEKYQTIDVESKEKFTNKNYLLQYQRTLKTYSKAFEESLQLIGKKALEEMNRWNLKREDFKGKSTSPVGIFKQWATANTKEPTATQLNLQNDVSKWFNKSDGANTIQAIEQAFPVLNECLVQGIDCYTKHYSMYLSIEAALKNFYTLGILSDLAYHAQAYGRENNMMLLSESSQLLRSIINDSDIPFVYEKVGSYIHHFMIDEFQDTSMMQWHNFEPLLRNSLASGAESLIVGDVKQSIYRWRNSDWTLLSEQVEKLFKENASVYNLAYNWRSSQQVVDFNNAFFEISAQVLQQTLNASVEQSSGMKMGVNVELEENFKSKITNAYKGQYQKLPEHKKDGRGYVHFERIVSPLKSSKLEVQMQLVERIPAIIEDLVSRNYQLKDLAIIVRFKDEGQLVANQLLKRGYPFVSDEVLQVRSSVIVQFLLSLLTSIDNKNNLENMLLLSSLYLSIVEGKTQEEAMTYIAKQNEDYIKNYNFLASHYRNKFLAINAASLYEIVAELVNLFQLQKHTQELVFLQAFLDIVWEYGQGRARTISTFLEWWEERGINRSLPGGDIPNAIRILTIHKSKGLEYRAVIVPFVTWPLESNRSQIIWCKPQQAPLNELPLLPISLSSKLVNTIFASDYYHEKVQSFVDNLNLAYVAFTRAIDELWGFINCSVDEKKTEVSDLSTLMLHTFKHSAQFPPLEKEQAYCSLNAQWDSETGIFELGKKQVAKYDQEPAQDEVISEHLMSFEFPHDRLSLFYQSADYFTNNKEINEGKLMHRVFSEIETRDQIDPVVKSLVDQGILSEAKAYAFKEKLQKSLSDSRVSDWFSTKYQVLNERAILLPNGKLLRPDRVLIDADEAIIIDYKFGEHQKSSYNKQVETYVAHLKTMGYPSVQAYLWYFELGIVEKVV